MKKSNWFWGVFLVLAGVLLVIAQVTGFQELGFWSIVAGILLVAVLVQSIASRSPVGVTVALGLMYVVFQRPLGLPIVQPWIMILAAALCGIGLSMLFRKKPNYHYQYNYGGANIEGGQPMPHYGGGGEAPAMETDANEDDNHPYAKVRFGATSRYLHSTGLENGQFVCSFGSMEVFFDQAQLSPNGAEVFLDCSFGAIKLYIPKHWNVDINMNTSLGGIENDTRFATPDRSQPKLALTGNVQLGAIEIAYV